MVSDIFVVDTHTHLFYYTISVYINQYKKYSFYSIRYEIFTIFCNTSFGHFGFGMIQIIKFSSDCFHNIIELFQNTFLSCIVCIKSRRHCHCLTVL